MALTLNEIQALTDDVWLPGSYDNWSKGNVMMMKLLEKASTVDSSEYIRVVLEHARANGGAMGESTVFNVTKKEVLNAARFQKAYYYTNLTITLKDETNVSGGKAEIDMVMTKLNNAQKSIKDYMGDDIWRLRSASVTAHGSGTEPFYGIPDLMLQTGTTAYGDIRPNDLLFPDGVTSMWLAYQNSEALTMSFETMQTLRRGCSVNNEGAGKPDLYVTTETLKDAYENSLQAGQRFYDEKMAAAGFENVKLGSRGVIVADDKCTANYVNAFNMEYLMLKAHKDFFFTRPEWKQPVNQYAKVAQIIFSGAIVTSQRRAHGQLTNVSA